MALDAHTVDMLREHRAECERAAEMFGRRFTDRYPVFAPASARLRETVLRLPWLEG